MSKTFIMNSSYYAQQLRVVGQQCKVDLSTFANSTLPKVICKRKRCKTCGEKQRLQKLVCQPYLPSLK